MTDTLDDLIREYVTLADQIAALTSRLDQVKTTMRSLGVGRHESSALGLAVTVSKPPARFNPDRFAEVVTTVELIDACTEPVISARKAKQILPPAVYALCCVEGGEPRVAVR